MARVVRPIPAMRASSAPRLATAAPTPTSGTAQSASTASTALTSGLELDARASEPRARSTETATTAYIATVMPSASGIARGIVRSGSRTSSPSVAILA